MVRSQFLRLVGWGALLLVAVLGAPLLLAQSGVLTVSTPVPWARFDVSVVRESSSLQKSQSQEDVFWTLSDSGNAPVLFALNRKGERLASFEVAGVENHDWESLALDDKGSLYIGDIGNNSSRRRDLEVYVVDEPQVHRQDGMGESQGTKGTPQPILAVKERLAFIYQEQHQPPDGGVRDFDAESLFWARGSLFLLTKERTAKGTSLYRFDLRSNGDKRKKRDDGQPVRSPTVSLRKIGRFDFGAAAHPTRGTATSADTTPDGRYLAVLGYRAVFIFERPETGDNYLSSAPLHIGLDIKITKQCEGITWDGEDLLLSNEQGELHRIVKPLENRPDAYP